LRDQGINIMRGPENPSMNDEIGLLIDGFDSSPVILMTYNPRYHINLVENYGFKKSKDLYAYVLPPGFESEKLTRVQKIVREKYQFTIREANLKNKEQFKKDANAIKEIYNAAWQPHWGFVKWTDEEMDFLAADLKMVADPKTSIFLDYKGKTIAFAISLPNLNECFIHNKRGTMLGAVWHMLTKKKKVKFTRIIALGILPEYQKMGFDSIMFYEIGHRAMETGKVLGEASWILEDNLMMNRSLTQTMNSKHYKTYRLYDINI
jgi:hypothetical protein